jgi:hypothetical protein
MHLKIIIFTSFLSLRTSLFRRRLVFALIILLFLLFFGNSTFIIRLVILTVPLRRSNACIVPTPLLHLNWRSCFRSDHFTALLSIMIILLHRLLSNPQYVLYYVC